MKRQLLLALLLFTAFLTWVSIALAENTADETVRISNTDTTSGNLIDKLDEGVGINIDNLVTGINEKLTISTEDKLATKGELLTHDGSGDSTLTVGTDGQVLVVDSVAPNGIKWGSAVDLSSPGPIGDTTPNSGSFTDLSASGDFELDSQRLQFFTLQIENVGGVLKHRISGLEPSISGASFLSVVNGATSSATTTPTGTNSTTAMAGGGKISSDTPSSIFVLDTSAQDDTKIMAMANVRVNSTGTALDVTPITQSKDINGVTKNRLSLLFLEAGTTNNFSLNTTNIASGEYVQVTILAFIAP